jgi:tetratricopeptide (TPR) repeat protein
MQVSPADPYLEALRLLRAGRAEEAAARFAAIRGAEPDHRGAQLNLARALLACGQADRALETLTPVSDAAFAEAHFLRGSALNALARPEQAVAAFVQAIAADPAHAAAHLNLANARADLGELDAAERLCRAAIALDPALTEAHASLGFVLTAMGRLDEAVAACDAAVRLSPGFAQAHWNRACALLLAGDYGRGFEAYEWRKRHPRFSRDFPPPRGPEWGGPDRDTLDGRTLLVRSEQGLGDTIQLARYLPLLAGRGGRVVLACHTPLMSLLAGLPGVAAVVPRHQASAYDLWVDQLSLPRLFGTRLDTIPAPGGYLRADPDRVRAVRDGLPPGRKIGIVWAGNPAHANDRRRSLPATSLARLLAVPNVAFVSLQVGPRAAEGAALGGILDLSPRLADFAETAAVIANLDLVLAVDTSVAHLAGALGRPVWLMLPHAPDWRWLTEREDSPWYASMRLFRQPRPGDWDNVIERVIAALAAPAA